ncbi:MAG: hypothetical protein ACR2PX_29090 [Endozoicomonas sp.]|uniref:hypothetical protein n=1 Tax=Endozoicomonas sp. TaxID=1892382 RepID=UPI003D9AF2AF
MMKKVKLSEVKKQKGKTDWNHLRKDEISPPIDPEAPELNIQQLAQMKPSKK